MDDSGYGNTKGNDALEDKYVRRLNSIKSSLSFRLGNLLVTSVMRPWKLAILPFTVTGLLWDFGRERLGKRSIGHEQELISNSSTRNCAILFPTNGVGMGHYARMYALAMAMKRKDPSLEIVFFTSPLVATL